VNRCHEIDLKTVVAPFFADLDPSAGGTIEMKYAAAPPWSAVDGIAAISPGRTAAFSAVDLSTTSAGGITGTGAIGERFADRPDLDLVELSRKFYDPQTKFLGEDSTVSVLGQEVGHRWLAYLRFSDHNRQSSGALLGRDDSHWSFFFNSDASVMEGNRIQDLGGGMFRTTGAVERYSLLDQYAMGLVRGRTATPADVAKIDRIRRAWEILFTQATSGRGRAETRLSPDS
jgi:hypothetical protein